jgi:hypothetical protein
MARRGVAPGAPRLAAAIAAGAVPAVMALLVVLVVAGGVTRALVIAAIAWVVIAALMWSRFGSERR